MSGLVIVDSGVANHLVQTVEASRLLGATVIVTGLSPEIAQTLVTIGVDLSEMATVGDLQGGIEEAERLLADRAPQTPPIPPQRLWPGQPPTTCLTSTTSTVGLARRACSTRSASWAARMAYCM